MKKPLLDLTEPGQALRVLLVDDNIEFRSILTRQLVKMGCIVDSAGEAGGFLTKIAEGKVHYDFAVVDLRLPDLDGDEIISWLRESEIGKVRALPVLVVTGFPDDFPKSLLADGAQIVLLGKPFRYSDLEKAVTCVLGNGRRVS